MGRSEPEETIGFIGGLEILRDQLRCSKPVSRWVNHLKEVIIASSCVISWCRSPSHPDALRSSHNMSQPFHEHSADISPFPSPVNAGTGWTPLKREELWQLWCEVSKQHPFFKCQFLVGYGSNLSPAPDMDGPSRKTSSVQTAKKSPIFQWFHPF